MLQLGYDEYGMYSVFLQLAPCFKTFLISFLTLVVVAQGGDWGSILSRCLARDYPQHCKATHINMDTGLKPGWAKHPLLALQHAFTPYSQSEKAGLQRTQWFLKEGSAYYREHASKPQTIGYALQDSPVALLAWIYEKLHDWTDGYPWTEDEVCTWISIYWFSTAGPAANVRIYYEATHASTQGPAFMWIPNVKLGISHFPKELKVLPRSWARTLGPLVFQKEHEHGGHFAAWERPQELVDDLRTMFGKKGGAYNVVQGKTGYPDNSARL